jgi:hypothetical protein
MTEPTWVGTVQSFPANWFLQKIKPESKKSPMEAEKSQTPFANLIEVTFFQNICSLPGIGTKIWHEID